jgi:two-component system, OmpR family, alkaline phosphatase synthesis response regulator PhoP
MSENTAVIVFLDNSVNKIFKVIESLKNFYPNIVIFTQEVDFFDYVSQNHTDIIFLNLDLQPTDGVVICKEIKQKNLEAKPFVIIYSDKQDEFIQELAFNSGADSFINFHSKLAIMKLFINNLLHRRKVITPEISKKDVIIDFDRYLIIKNGVSFQLPKKEFKIFQLLYANAEKFFTKQEIAESIWHDESISNKRTIDVHIYNIRQFFGKRFIQSQKGKGYRMNKKLIG